MRLHEIKDILYYKKDNFNECHGLLYHFTKYENLDGIKSCGLLSGGKLRETQLDFQPFGSLGSSGPQGNNDVFLFTHPKILLAYLRIYRILLPLQWLYAKVNIVTVLLSFSTELNIDPSVGLSQGFPNALMYPKSISKNNIDSIETLNDFIERLGLMDFWSEQLDHTKVITEWLESSIPPDKSNILFVEEA